MSPSIQLLHNKLTLRDRATGDYKDSQQWQDLTRDCDAIAGIKDRLGLEGSSTAELWKEFKSLAGSVSIALHGFKNWDLELDVTDNIQEALEVMAYAQCT